MYNLERLSIGVVVLEDLSRSLYLVSHMTMTRPPSSFHNSRHMDGAHKKLRQSGCLQSPGVHQMVNAANHMDVRLYAFTAALIETRWSKLVQDARLSTAQASEYLSGGKCAYVCKYDQS